ncbi:hypothetical protein KFZ76_08385 [Methylovulum psychrotolerans]|jgi:uncharacterized low-complexity protein|uniref:HvfA family oxazolone/thioamide-modified RiPP metallophore n=1 Tax=Methylovulum psychrotolerans TaxID=1704499 RepID=UPI001BFF38F3|nr:hypothetical protein [Methylovulum psychrotolerans]MBT9097722.1 hypothetical protein [Methylovulum psychrotolerans]
MNRQTLRFTFGSIIATALTAAPMAYADGNPFGMSELGHATVLAETAPAATDKAKEGKCGEGKCGAEKAQKQAEAAAATDKAAEGKCGAGKMGTDKMPEGSCGGAKK